MSHQRISAAADAQAAQAGYLADLLGIAWLECGPDLVRGRLDVQRHHLASTGFLHAAAVIALADTAAGYGCLAALPDGAAGFTTAELKANYLGTARSGAIACVARPVHKGRTTQVWDAEVRHLDRDKSIALFRCTQIILYPSVEPTAGSASPSPAPATAAEEDGVDTKTP